MHPAFLYAAHPLACVSGPFNAVTIESEAITEITLSGPGRRRPADRERGARRRHQRDDPARVDARRPPARLPIVYDVESAFYLHLEVADRPGVLAQIAQLLGLQGASIRSVVQKGLGENARLVMVTHPILESRFFAAVELIAGAGLHARPPARDPRHRRRVRLRAR